MESSEEREKVNEQEWNNESHAIACSSHKKETNDGMDKGNVQGIPSDQPHNNYTDEPYYSKTFCYENGVLYCENTLVGEIRQQLRNLGVFPASPFFLYSKAQMEKNISDYTTALEEQPIHYHLNYAMKANMNPSVLKIMKENGCSLTLVSGMELQLAQDMGFSPEFMVFNGNGKQRWEIEMAVKAGCLLNIDSEFNLMQTVEICHALEKAAKVLLRINPDIDPNVHHYVSTGKEGTKFGLALESLERVTEVIKREPLLELLGLHCHLGSTIDQLDVFSQSTDVMIRLFQKLKSAGFSSIRYLNLGGGLGIPYKRHADQTHRKLPDDRPQLCKSMPSPSELISNVAEKIRHFDIVLILEPGRSLVGNAVVLVTSVLGTKLGEKKNFIVVDGAMTEVIRPSLYGAYHHIDLIEPCDNSSTSYVFDVVGPVCECADFLGKDRYLPMPKEGCGLAVFDVGAYCGSMSSNYNMRLRPAEVLVDKDKWRLIRRPDTFQDLLSPYTDTKEEISATF